MALSVTITAQNVTDEYGRALAVGSTASLPDAYATSLVSQGRASYSPANPPSLTPNVPFFPVPIQYVPGPSDYPATNVANIQRALDNAGTVIISEPGTYYVSETLYIGDNTDLSLALGVTIKAAPGLKQRMLACKSSLALPTTVSASWSSNDAKMTVTWANHGLTDADYVCIQGATLTGTVTGATQANPCVITSVAHGMQTGDRVTFNSDIGGMTQLNGNSYVITRLSADTFSLQSLIANIDSSAFTAFTSGGTWYSIQHEYNNVFRVFDVVNANSFVVLLYETPTIAPAGTLNAVRCTRNFSIQGGVWDYDSATNVGTPPSLDRHAITIHYAARFSVQNLNIRNVLKYGFNTCAVANYNVENIDGVAVAEIFKHYGPAVNGTVRGIYGDAIDDCSTVQMREPPDFIGYQPACGDIINLSIDEVSVRSKDGTSSGVIVVYASDHDKCINLTLSRFYAKGEIANALSIKSATGFTVGSVDSVYIVDCILGTRNGTAALNISTVEVDEIRLTRPVFVPSDLATALSTTNGIVNIESLCVEGMKFYNEVWPSSGQSMFQLSGRLGRFIAERCDIRGSSNAIFTQVPSTSLLIENIILRDSNFDGISSVVDARAFCNIHRENSTFKNIANGALRIQTATGLTARIYGAGHNAYASATAIVCLTPATCEIYDWDTAIDPVALTQLATTVGQFLTSTQAGADGGPCVKTSVGWVALGTGAAGINTIIT